MSDRNKKRTMFLGVLERLEDRQLLTLALAALDISPLQGKQFNGVVAKLLDSNVAALPTSFTVDISWQYGLSSASTPGTVVRTSTLGTYDIYGSNTYPQVGTFTTQINVTDANGVTAVAEGTATVAPQPLTILANAISGIENQPLPDPTVLASFVDPNTADQSNQFSALVGWGDGQSGLAQVNRVGPGQFTVTVPGSDNQTHTYTAPGSYTTTISVVGQGNLPSATATGSADISSSGIELSGQTIVATVGQALNQVTVASIADPTATYTSSQFTALISWGDGPATEGMVTGKPGSLTVVGSHTYEAPGSYPITVTLGSPDGSTYTSASTATVLSLGTSATFSGALAPVGNGPGAAAGFASTNRPTFSGAAAPFSTVQLFARPSSYDTNESLGYAIASSSGQWTLAAGPLADGIYTVTAVVTPPGSSPSSAQALAGNGVVVIDTATPQVVRVAPAGGNHIKVFFADNLSGMNQTNLSQTSNYILSGPHLAGFHPSAAGVLPGGNLPTGVIGVLLTIPGTRRTLAQVRRISIRGTNIVPSGGSQTANIGITDNAGNPLQSFSQNLVSQSGTKASGSSHVSARALSLRARHAPLHA